MAESTLSTEYDDLQAEIGHYLGYGRTPSKFTVAQAADVLSVMKAGLRKFYFNGAPWTFLKPTYTMVLATRVGDYDLPDEFGGFSGDMTLAGTSSNYWNRVPWVGEGTIRSMRAQSDSAITGQPRMAACKAAAELHLDGAAGPMDADFQKCLQSSIALDGRQRPELVGYNGDRSVRRASDNVRRATLTVDVNGVATEV